MPTTSVLMVVLDEEEHLERAAESVLAQSEDDLELLVIDGGSTDGTRDIVGDLRARDPRVRALDNPARIIPAGLNVGLAAARGRYVARLDGHSQWKPDVLERGVALLEAWPGVAAVGGRRLGVGDGRTGRGIAAALSSRLGVGNSIYHYGEEPAATDHATCGVYRTDVARAVGGWDEDLPVNEDVDFDHRIRDRGWGIRFDPQMETHWQVQPDVGRLFRQYRRYGRGKSEMIRKNGWRALRARHCAPPALVLTVAGALVAGGASRRWAALSPIAAYGASLSGAALMTRRRTLDDTFGVFLLALSAMHFGWGVGFLESHVLGTRPHGTSRVGVAP